MPGTNNTEWADDPTCIRTVYNIDGKQFDGWETLDTEELGFGCLWPYALCGQPSKWSRIAYLDATDTALRQRIPYATLCEMHWMNRGQLCLDIPEPEPVKVSEWRQLEDHPEAELRCMVYGCARAACWEYHGVLYCNQHHLVRLEADEVDNPLIWGTPTGATNQWNQNLQIDIGVERPAIHIEYAPPGYYGEEDPR